MVCKASSYLIVHSLKGIGQGYEVSVAGRRHRQGRRKKEREEKEKEMEGQEEGKRKQGIYVEWKTITSRLVP